MGDDYQSIYRFTGCDLRIFINFKYYFEDASICKIENTYRNSQELIDIAGNFIMKNSFQLKKELKSMKSVEKPIKIVYYKNSKKDFEKLLNKIGNKKILILGRNNSDINNYYKIDETKTDIKYMTIHKSKGLEEDNVILINMLDKINGFPNKMVDDSVLDFVLTTHDRIAYEEERRLFYVALTRAREIVYIFTKKRQESVFIKELIKNNRANIDIINIF